MCCIFDQKNVYKKKAGLLAILAKSIAIAIAILNGKNIAILIAILFAILHSLLLSKKILIFAAV